MKTSLIFSLTILLLLVGSLQFTLAFETQQDPRPPEIPEPSPEPEPIQLPDPEPTPEPFPGDTESEKIQRLTEENDKLKQQNINLQGQISTLKNERLGLQTEISELNDTIKSLKEITMEQIRVIMNLVNQLKDVLFEKIFSSTTIF
ncbi:MAG: hypothetical protein ISR80_02495 [Nitrosopumilus sp.]|nr:hypothetical protein [Nitrosopumilus sp.]MDC4232009.1 hypothetical protein [Nitrosopumilus sp.]